MMIPLLTKIKNLVKLTDLSMELFYTDFEISRQGFSQALIRRSHKQKLFELIKPEVLKYRLTKDRRAGSRSLFYNLNIKNRYNIGVNKFERILSENNLTLVPLRVNVVTTKSVHQSWNYDNLINGLIIRGVNELIVGDITYIGIGKYRYYLFCLTDAFSMKIVGYCLSNRMRKQEALEALEMFLKQVKDDHTASCIHHTDGGGQYFSDVYLDRKPKWMQISVARSCIENGLAEQMNGYIKNHLVPLLKYTELTALRKEIARMIDNYNNRKQKVLGWKTPFEVEEQTENKVYSNRFVRLHDHIKNVPSLRQGF